jgi:hypothetical protein
MEYLYGEFSDKQIELNAIAMHNAVHKLLLYKDVNVSSQIFDTEEQFQRYFQNLLYRFGGFNELLGEPVQMVSLMSTLQAAYDEIEKDNFDFIVYRRLILDAHGFISSMFNKGV